MKAVVFHDIGDIRVEEVLDPVITDPTDAIVGITTSAICGTDLHMIRGTMPGMKKDTLLHRGTILGHEGVGIVQEVGSKVSKIHVGDRVIIPSTIACGTCKHCKEGEYAQCDRANPNGPHAGTAFYGGPKMTGPFDGLQAEKARVPFADTNLVKVPDTIPDEQAILLSDILPTGYMAAEMAEITPGDRVAIFGCGPVGLMAIMRALYLGAKEVYAIDAVESRLEKAQELGAVPIDYNRYDPVKKLRELTDGLGPESVIDAVGVDANQPDNTMAVVKEVLNLEQLKVAPKQNKQDGNWHPGNAPFQVLTWATEAVQKSGTISIIGVYPQHVKDYPIGMAMNKNLRLHMGNCNHRKYIPELIELIQQGKLHPERILTQEAPAEDVIEAYKHFDKREEGWIKVALV